MATSHGAFICVLSLLLVAPAAAAQERQQIIISGEPGDGPMPFPGMGPRQFKTGTARIRGRVIAADTGAGLRRVQVRIAGPDVQSRLTMTDADGRFEFRDLPAGRFNVFSSKSGYVSVQYGQTRPFEAGKPIELADGQLVDKADISMPRGSVISGRVLDEAGDPVTDAMVSAMRSAWVNGRRRLQPTGRMGSTNDLGQFRLYGLPPGDYFVSATLRDMAMMEMNFAAMGPGAPPPNTPPSSGYAPTYFPGIANGSEAQKITIASGQDAHNTDFALLPVRLSKISGVVISSEGKPVAGTMINAMPRSADVAFGPMLGSSTRTGPNGSFTLNGVAPGDYTLQTRSFQMMTSGSGDMVTVAARASGPGDESEVGQLQLSVGGEDISNVVIVTSKGATATGQVTFEGGTRPASLPTLRINASPVLMEGPMMGPGGGPASVGADGSFTLRGLSGLRIVRPAPVPPGWMLKEVRVNGADVTDSGIEFKAGETLAGLEVVLTSRVTQVAGTVKTPAGAPVQDYTVVVFSDDPERWALPNNRHVAGVRPDQDGRFQVKNLPAGRYYAVAAEYLAQGEWGDPEVLDRLKARATSFTLKDGESKTLDLTMR